MVAARSRKTERPHTVVVVIAVDVPVVVVVVPVVVVVVVVVVDVAVLRIEVTEAVIIEVARLIYWRGTSYQLWRLGRRLPAVDFAALTVSITLKGHQ